MGKIVLGGLLGNMESAYEWFACSLIAAWLFKEVVAISETCGKIPKSPEGQDSFILMFLIQKAADASLTSPICLRHLPSPMGEGRP